MWDYKGVEVSASSFLKINSFICFFTNILDFQLLKCNKIFYHFLFVKIHVMQIWRKTDDPQAIVCTNSFEVTAQRLSKNHGKNSGWKSLWKFGVLESLLWTVMFASSQNKVTLRVMLWVEILSLWSACCWFWQKCWEKCNTAFSCMEGVLLTLLHCWCSHWKLQKRLLQT